MEKQWADTEGLLRTGRDKLCQFCLSVYSHNKEGGKNIGKIHRKENSRTKTGQQYTSPAVNAAQRDPYRY